MRLFGLTVLWILMPFGLFSQSAGKFHPISQSEAKVKLDRDQNLTVDSLQAAVQQLRIYADSMTRGTSDAIRKAYCALFNPMLLDILSAPVSFNFDFDTLKTLSALKSPDGQVRVYSWFLQSRDKGTFEFFGVVQKQNANAGGMRVSGLIEKKHPTDFAEINLLDVDEWYGAVYYDIIERKINKRTCYFLLGWHGNDRQSTRKLIDVLSFDFWDNAEFGMPVFTGQSDVKVKYRVVFELQALAVMVLRYDKKLRMLVFDHLSPANPTMKGNFSQYGPDFTYDGYRFKKGKWVYKKNLELRN